MGALTLSTPLFLDDCLLVTIAEKISYTLRKDRHIFESLLIEKMPTSDLVDIAFNRRWYAWIAETLATGAWIKRA